MKKFYLLIATLLVVVMTSMMLTQENESQQTTLPTMDESQPMFLKGMITIKLKKGVGDFSRQDGNISFNIPSLDSKADKFEVDLLEKRFKYNPQKLRDDLPDLSRIYRIEFSEKYPVTKVAREFSKDPHIEYAEPIPIPYLAVEPNDTMYDQCQHLPQILAPQAWEIHKGEDGTEEVVIAIIDNGVDWDHEDLVDNIWQNLGEDFDGDGKTLEFIGGEWIFDPDDENGVDDDGNGFVDDFIGWDFYTYGNDPNPIIGKTHGTLCAGLAGAITNNNIGVASISWNLKILPVQADHSGGDVYGFDGIIYAAENGADVISNSWLEIFYSQANHEVITYAIGLGSIIVACAGNSNKFINYYPADLPGVISVASVESNDQRSNWSNFGPNIGISSPGGGVLSTTPNDEYHWCSGTSYATPLSAGLLGLVKSFHPDWTSDQVITQVLGTADDIDYLNPEFENLLGSGRINAFTALDSTGVTLQQEITIDLVHSTCHDADGNNMLEPGDTVSMSFKLRNYNYGVSADNATFTLTTEDPDILILNDTCYGNIPADNFFTLENVFQFKITDEAVIHLVNFKLLTTADVEITWGDTISFEALVVPEGILVYQGEGSGNTFSGDYIYEFLVEQGLPVFYSSHFPFSLNGFDVVFLSYGNYGLYLEDGKIVTMGMSDAMTEYLLNGGYIYAECGSFFGIMEYSGYPNFEELMELFGVEEVETPLTQNYIDLLNGLPGSLCEELVFTGHTQNPYWYIDKMTPNDNGIAAFEEEDYGTVAVQGEGEYGQKTFCFSYALAHLEDSEYGTRDTLLNNIIEFFDLYDPVADFRADTTIIAEGDTVNFTDLSTNNPTSWEWEFEGGTPETSIEQNPVVVYNNTGSFDVTLIVSNEYGSDTLLIFNYINPDLGIDTDAGLIPGDVNIFPVPANDRLFISCKMNFQSVEILNISGQVEENQECNTKQLIINIANLPNGIYFIRLQLVMR